MMKRNCGKSSRKGASSKKRPKQSSDTSRKVNVRNEKKDVCQSDYEEGELDLNKEMHDIGYYINDRQLMVNNMFATISGSKLKSMLPSILQNVSIDEIKNMCFEVLEGMSKKRIKHILAGKEMDSSSGTEDSSDDNEGKKAGSARHNADSTSIDTENDQVSSANANQDCAISPSGVVDAPVPECKSVTVDALNLCPDDDELTTLLPKPQELPQCTSSSMNIPESLQYDACDTTQKVSSVSSFTSVSTKVRKSEPTKEMEILELELRAKAIRALMKMQEPEHDS